MRSRTGKTFASRHRPILAIMVKAPVMGRVKTRLGRQIGPVTATRFFRSAVPALVRRLQRDPRWHTVLAIAPQPDLMTAALPAGTWRIAQSNGDLGARMQQVMDHPLGGRRRVPGPVLIIGTDIPAICPQDVADAFARLGSQSAVLGPAPDGGFWSVGYARAPKVPRAFGGVRWSSASALSDTVARLGGADHVAKAATLADVDDAETWQAVRPWSGRVVLPVAVRQR